jgi:hypothetical protein
MTVIKVAMPPRTAYDPNRAVSSLLKMQVEHLYEVEKRLPSHYRSEVYVNAIKTEGGAAIAGLMVPGLGPILAIGLGCDRGSGAGRATAGAKADHQTEHALVYGIAKDDVKFYHAALRSGLSLVIAHVDSEDQ